MSTRHTRVDRHQMWCDLGDMWEQAQGFLAMLALTMTAAGAATLVGLALAEAATAVSPWLVVGIIAAALLGVVVVRKVREASAKLDAIFREDEAATARARVARSLALVDAPPCYAEVWDRHVCAFVCAQCGAPVAADPCPVHGPAATDAEEQTWPTA